MKYFSTRSTATYEGERCWGCFASDASGAGSVEIFSGLVAVALVPRPLFTVVWGQGPRISRIRAF